MLDTCSGFEFAPNFSRRYAVHEVGGKTYREYWVPAEDLSEFNRNIVGKIEIVGEFP